MAKVRREVENVLNELTDVAEGISKENAKWADLLPFAACDNGKEG